MENTQVISTNKFSEKSAHFSDYVIITLPMILWGGTWPVAKVLLDTIPPLTLGFIRYLIASIFLLPTLFFNKRNQSTYDESNKNRKSINRHDWFLFFMLGLTGIFIYGWLFLAGLRYTTASQGAIIAGVDPITITLFGHIMHGERLEVKWKYFGFLISFTGVFLIIGIQSFVNFNRNHFIGNLLILLAMFFWGLYSNLGKTVMKKFSALEVVTISSFFGMILFGLSATTERFWMLWDDIYNLTFIFSIAYISIISTYIGFILYFKSIDKIGPTRVSVFMNLVPVFGVLFSIIFIHEKIFPLFLVGLVLIIIGISLINYPVSPNTSKQEKGMDL